MWSMATSQFPFPPVEKLCVKEMLNKCNRISILSLISRSNTRFLKSIPKDPSPDHGLTVSKTPEFFQREQNADLIFLTTEMNFAKNFSSIFYANKRGLNFKGGDFCINNEGQLIARSKSKSVPPLFSSSQEKKNSQLTSLPIVHRVFVPKAFLNRWKSTVWLLVFFVSSKGPAFVFSHVIRYKKISFESKCTLVNTWRIVWHQVRFKGSCFWTND